MLRKFFISMLLVLICALPAMAIDYPKVKLPKISKERVDIKLWRPKSWNENMYRHHRLSYKQLPDKTVPARLVYEGEVYPYAGKTFLRQEGMKKKEGLLSPPYCPTCTNIVTYVVSLYKFNKNKRIMTYSIVPSNKIVGIAIAYGRGENRTMTGMVDVNRDGIFESYKHSYKKNNTKNCWCFQEEFILNNMNQVLEYKN